MTAADRTELDRLLSALCDAQLTEDEHARLEQFLAAAPDARQQYLEYVDLHSHMQTRLASATPATVAAPRERRSHGWHRYLLGAAVAVCATVLAQIVFLRPAVVGPDGPSADPKTESEVYVATLVRADGCEWVGPGPVAAGARVVPGELRLKAGVARLVFDSGASLILEGGTAIRVESKSAATVLAGKVVFRGDDNPEVFNLRTPRALLQDLGTEYAVAVGPEGEEIHVFDGEVRRLPSGAAKRDLQLNAGEARRFAADPTDAGSEMSLEPGRFVRTVPPTPAAADPTDGLLAYDGFDYPADSGNTFENANGGFGWVGSWRKTLARPKTPARGVTRAFNPAAGLTRPHAGVPPANGAYDYTGFIKAYRKLASPVRMDTDGVYYLSFLFRRGGPQADPLNAVSVLLRTTEEMEREMRNDADQRVRLNFGVDRSNAVFTHLNRVGRRLPLPLSYDQTYLFAAKVVTGKTMPDQTFIRVYGPDERVNWDEPTDWTLVGPEVHSDLVFDLLQVHINSQTRQTLDEVRLGVTWAAVAHPWIDDQAPGK